MKKERLFLSVGALVIGLIVAVVAFYLYQSAKVISPQKNRPLTNITKPTPKSTFFLSLAEPRDEEVSNKRVITVSGKTEPKVTLLIYTQDSEETAISSNDGSFSTTIAIAGGVNKLSVTAASPNGEIQTIVRTVSFTSENF